MKALFPLFLFPLLLTSQAFHSSLDYEEGIIRLADGIEIGTVASGYLASIPESPIGAVVFFNAREPLTSNEEIIRIATEKHLAVIYLTTKNKFEFLFGNDAKEEMASYLHDAIERFNIPPDNLCFAGMSLAGTRALIMTKYLHETPGYSHLEPRCIAICDSPLDFIRFYKQGRLAFKRNIDPIAANEGFWTSEYLKQNLTGDPDEALPGYLNYSPISHLKPDSSRLDHLIDIPIRAYTEPDIDWWMDHRGKDYYGMNAIDLAFLINELNYLGHTQAELISTVDRGYRPDGTRHPHSWSIVDERDLVDWFVSLID